MNRLKGKNKGIGEIPLFRSMSIFLQELLPVVMNMQKDVKLTFGNNLLNDCYGIVGDIRRCYDTVDLKEKYVKCVGMIETFAVVETEIKMLSELKQISIKTTANLMLDMGDILIQMNGWKSNLEKRMNSNIA